MAPPTQAGPASPAVGGKENLNLPQDAQLQELHAELSHARNALREMVWPPFDRRVRRRSGVRASVASACHSSAHAPARDLVGPGCCVLA